MPDRKFKIGDKVRLIEPYRSRRLANNPRDIVANAGQVTVSHVGDKDVMSVEFGPYRILGFEEEGNRPHWVSGAFENAEGPW